MNPLHNTEDRLTELEIKATYAEDQLDQLDQLDRIIVRQQQQIDHLLRELAHLRQLPQPGDVGAARNLRDELPPHF